MNKNKTYEFISQRLVRHKHLNPYGFLFGGEMLSWLDEAGAVYVINKIKYETIVTVAMDHVVFKNPAKPGSIIKFYAYIDRMGSSSVTVKLKAVSEDAVSEKSLLIIECDVTYVCLDDKGKPFARFTGNSIKL